MLRRRRVGVAALAAIIVAAALLALTQLGGHEAREVAFVVPPGTAERLAAGETVSVLPSTILLRVGDTLVIRNDDTAAVQVGPFRVDPGQRLAHQYRNPGTYELECSVHADGTLRIVVGE